MELHRIRLFLLLAMFAVGIVLYGEWQKEHPPKPLVSTEKNTTTELISFFYLQALFFRLLFACEHETHVYVRGVAHSFFEMFFS